MFYLFEISRLKILDSSLLVPIDSFVYKAKLTTAEVAEYITEIFGMTDLTNKVDMFVSEVLVDFNRYQKVEDLSSLVEESFYFDGTEQVLYIYFNHTVNPFAVSTEIGETMGFTDDTVRYFNGIPYLPIVKDFPRIIEQVDALHGATLSFNDISISLDNDVDEVVTQKESVIVFGDGSTVFGDSTTVFGEHIPVERTQVGRFDTDPVLYGMSCRILRGNSDNYNDMETVIENSIATYTTTLDSFDIEGHDKRRQLEIQYPTDVFSGAEFDDTNGKLIPDGYGRVIQVQAYPVAKDADAVVFRWGQSTSRIEQVYAVIDDKLTEVSHSAEKDDG